MRRSPTGWNRDGLAGPRRVGEGLHKPRVHEVDERPRARRQVPAADMEDVHRGRRRRVALENADKLPGAESLMHDDEG